MKNAYNTAIPASFRAVRPFISRVLCLLLLAGLIPLRAQDTAAPSSSTVVLRFQDASFQNAGYAFASWNVPLRTSTAAFKKEPGLGHDKLCRGTLQFGSNPNNAVAFTTNALAFIWDRTAKKLYLDLNRNQDLTDDPAGVIAAGAIADRFQSFNGIRLPLQTKLGPLSVLVDLNFYAYGNEPSCSAQLHSFWQGQLTLAGQDCQVGLAPSDFDQLYLGDKGRLLLRPWTARTQTFTSYGNSLDTFPFGSKLFIRDHAFWVDCSSESAATGPQLTLRFTEQHPVLGELRLPGKFIQRLILQDGPYQVVLDQPKKVERIPVGTYNQLAVWLQVGAAQAYHDGRQTNVISERQPATCSVGGPLTNSVAIAAQGRLLTLSYQVLGAGGETYQYSRDISKAPRFTIKKEGKVLAAGKFEFG